MILKFSPIYETIILFFMIASIPLITERSKQMFKEMHRHTTIIATVVENYEQLPAMMGIL